MSESAMECEIGGLARDELVAHLVARGIQLNIHARTLLEHPCFAERTSRTSRTSRTVDIAQRTLLDLGLRDGGSLPQIIAAGWEHGLAPCPSVTGPYLRLAMQHQVQAPDSVLFAGRVPAGALNVISEPLSEDPEYPKGFYLRVVDGVSWLRGFRCDDEYRWPAESLVVLRRR